MNEGSDKLIYEIEGRFKFIITLSIFFPTLMYSLSKLAGESEQKSAEMILTLGGTGGLFILDYFFFELEKKKIKDKWLAWISRILLAGIGFYVIPILFLSVGKNAEIPTFLGYLFAAPYWAIMLMAVVIMWLISIPSPKGMKFGRRLKKPEKRP